MTLSVFFSIIISLLVLSIVVLFHEVGHFAVARVLGFKIEEFSIGFGPRLFKKSHGDTEYSLRILPLGGFVRFLGEDEVSHDKRAFNNQAAWKRALVLFAGPFMNVFLALLIAVIVLFSYGDYFPVPVIGQVVEDSPAAQAGLKVGDRIIAVNGTDVKDYEEVYQRIQESLDKKITFMVLRDEEKLTFEMKPYYDQKTQSNRIGIVFAQEKMRFSFGDSIRFSVQWTVAIIREMIAYLGRLFFRGQGINDLMGPVGTIGLIGQAARQGVEMVLRLSILISINLGVINLLPFPALDGGRLFFLAIEGLRGKPLSQEKEGLIHFAGFVVLILLMVLITFQDFTR